MDGTISVAVPETTVTPAPVVPAKRTAEPPLTPAASVDENILGAREGDLSSSSSGVTALSPSISKDDVKEPPKKKRRVALTRVGDLGS